MLGQRTTVFFHIPKTAGTTLSSIFTSRIPPERRFIAGSNGHTHIEDALAFAQFPADQKRKYQFVTGHLEMPAVESLPPGSFVFTFLRSPVARCISLYNFVRRTPTHHMHGMLAGGMGLEEFVARAKWDEVRNGMTRRLAGVINKPLPAYDTAVLKRAMFNLAARFDFVGVQENFDASLLLLGRMLGIPADQLLYRRRNTNPDSRGKDKVGKETKQYLLENNRMDLELYEFAKNRFADLSRAQEPGLQREIKVFKKRLKQQHGEAAALGQAA